MRAFIVGGTGQIGRAVAAGLLAGYQREQFGYAAEDAFFAG